MLACYGSYGAERSEKLVPLPYHSFDIAFRLLDSSAVRRLNFCFWKAAGATNCVGNVHFCGSACRIMTHIMQENRSGLGSGRPCRPYRSLHNSPNSLVSRSKERDREEWRVEKWKKSDVWWENIKETDILPIYPPRTVQWRLHSVISLPVNMRTSNGCQFIALSSFVFLFTLILSGAILLQFGRAFPLVPGLGAIYACENTASSIETFSETTANLENIR